MLSLSDLCGSACVQDRDLLYPELLRAFAGQVDTASSAIRAPTSDTRRRRLPTGLPASTTQWAMRLVGEHMAQQANDIATNITKMGAAVRGAGDKYEVEDNALAGSFDGLF